MDTNSKTNINLTENESSKTDTFFKDPSVKVKLSRTILNGQDLKLYLLFKFGDYVTAGKAAGLADTRIHQIASGIKVPQSPVLIQRIAKGWDVEIVTLTQLFDRLRGEHG